MKIGFFEVRPGEEDFFRTNLPNEDLIFSTEKLTPENFSQYTDLEIVATHISSKVTPEVILGLPKLKLIATRTTGFDHIDLPKAKEKNITVCNVPSYGEVTVAEFALALIISFSRKIPQSLNRVRNEKNFSPESLQGFDLQGKTLGVVGTGHIGAHLMQIAHGFEMKILGFDAFPNMDLAQKLGFEYKGLEELLGSSDIISLHVPYLPSTHHLINTQNISAIKKGALLVNTARGAVIETEALVQALEQGILSGAALDVLEEENDLKQGTDPNSLDESKRKIYDLNQKLIGMNNVLVTPHNAFDTKEAEQRILQTTVDNIKAFESGNPINIAKPH